MSETSRIRINLSAVESNIRILRDVVGPETVICPIVKADAYGLGAAPIARHLVAAGAGMLAVYTSDQAAVLARSAIGGPILVLLPVRRMQRIDEAYRLLIRGDLHLTVHDSSHLDDLGRIAEHYATVIPLHLEVDTGMSRGGCAPAEAPVITRRISKHRWLRLAGMSTHFARAASDARFTNKQLSIFDEVLATCSPSMPEECLIHAANSVATLRHRRYHKTMVRVGQAWAGLGAEHLSDGSFRRQGAELRPIVSWTSNIVQIKTIERGTTVGYGSTWTARRRSRIGLVPVGYADGYPMGLAATDAEPKPACVRVDVAKPGGTSFVRVVGQVNMDQITIDLTDLASPRSRDPGVGVGTEVELIGTDPRCPNHVPTLARTAGTVPHQVMCSLNPRIKRSYHATERYQREAVSSEQVSVGG
ncbi:MAG: alanine racemase [Planctomycetes bacterium]|nr:alanine racemase [Planctomycetota bacterium]